MLLNLSRWRLSPCTDAAWSHPSPPGQPLILREVMPGLSWLKGAGKPSSFSSTMITAVLQAVNSENWHWERAGFMATTLAVLMLSCSWYGPVKGGGVT